MDPVFLLFIKAERFNDNCILNKEPGHIKLLS